MRARSLLFMLLGPALGGCSYSYDLLAVVIDGRLAFVVDSRSSHYPNCIRSIHVATDEVARATPAATDDRELVANGVFWWQDYAVDACPNPFPIFYGQPLNGRRFALEDGSTASVEAKPLRIGVIYKVDAESSGSGYGAVNFRILSDRHVQNLPMGEGQGR